MNLGNLISNKLIESKYENKKELYEALKEMVGEECCAYNTFTEALSKNKRLSDVELLTLSTLLNIDLNKLALHYVNSKMTTINNISIDEYIKENNQELLSFISYIMGDDYNSSTFASYTLSSIDDKAYFLHFNKKSGFIICYEFAISKNKNSDYTLKTKEVARFKYFKSILDSNGLDVDTFISMNFNDKINLLKSEGKVYYELFPSNNKSIEDTTLDKFVYKTLKNISKEYIENNKDYVILTENNKLLLDEEIKCDKDIEYLIENELYDKNIYKSGIIYSKYSTFKIFKEEALKILPITTNKELEDSFNSIYY